MANAIWYAIRTAGETFASVGGGITLGICTHAHDRFVWPPVEIDGERFYRGVRVPELNVDVDSRHVVRFAADIEYMAGLDQRIEDARLSGLERLPGTAPESRRCTFGTTLDEFIGTHPLRRTREPRELSWLEL